MKPTSQHVDALEELVNIGAGRAAGVLNEMLNSRVSLHVPDVKILPAAILFDEAAKLEHGELFVVRMDFSGLFSGISELVIPCESASNLVTAITDDENTDQCLDEIRTGTLLEIGNIILNGVMGSISNIVEQHIEYSMPIYICDPVQDFILSNSNDSEDTMIVAHTRFEIEHLSVDGHIYILFDMGSFSALADAIDRMNS